MGLNQSLMLPPVLQIVFSSQTSINQNYGVRIMDAVGNAVLDTNVNTTCACCLRVPAQ